MPTLRRLAVAAAIAASALPIARADACTSDTQCKGDRICESGACIESSETPLPNVGAPKEDERGNPNWHSSGPAMGVGSGYQTAGFGAALAIYAQITEVFRVAPWFGVGNLKRDQLFFMNFDIDNTLDKWGWAAGMMMLIGAKHRFVLDVGYGLSAIHEEFSAPNNGVVIPTYGITGAGGYEVMTRGGFFFRLLVGITHLNDDARAPSSYPSQTDRNPMTAEIILGAKPW